ncbi:MAG: zinc-ribbon domain-containing protein [Methanobrevibacter sp.]|nr:zinc-ribbon domain-containing protein [Methanobrevibacter sp.]
MANFCTNCGAKIEKEYNFCINCGTKIDKSDMKENNQLAKSIPSNKNKTKEKEIAPTKIEKNKMTRGGYCGLSCRHCYEEFLDSGGGITGDFDSDGYVEYYCHLGHSVAYGRFCEDYE